MLTEREKNNLKEQLRKLKEQKSKLEAKSSVKESDTSKMSISERLKKIQKEQIIMQTQVARLRKRKNKKLMQDTSGKPGKVMVDKSAKAKCITPNTGKVKEKKAYENFDPDLLECIKRRDAWDTAAKMYIYEDDNVLRKSQFQDVVDNQTNKKEDEFGNEFEEDNVQFGDKQPQNNQMGVGQTSSTSFGQGEQVGGQTGGQGQFQDVVGGGEGEDAGMQNGLGGEEDAVGGDEELADELRMLNKKILQLKQFADSITPDELKNIEGQQSKLQKVIDKEEGQFSQEGQPGHEEGESEQEKQGEFDNGEFGEFGGQGDQSNQGSRTRTRRIRRRRR